MSTWLFAPIFLQGFLMAIDEGYCHRKRDIPMWERIGHPLDTLSVLTCMGLCAFVDATDLHLKIFAAFAVFSCVLVTKDEFVHRKFCDGLEHWLHALLFVLHPIVLFSCAGLWKSGEAQSFLKIQFVLLTTFLIYQVYKGWNGYESQSKR